MIHSSKDFLGEFSEYVEWDEETGSYFFPESPMGLWVSFEENGSTTISGWMGSSNRIKPNYIQDFTAPFPICPLQLMILLISREDASQAISQAERAPKNEQLPRDWYSTPEGQEHVRFWRESWSEENAFEGYLDEDVENYFKSVYLKTPTGQPLT